MLQRSAPVAELPEVIEMTLDPVTRYLQSRDCPREVVRGGLARLVQTWEEVVGTVVRGYDHPLDHYLKDMDLRDILFGALEAQAGMAKPGAPPDPLAQRVAAADKLFMEATKPTNDLWGDPDDGDGAPDPSIQWWYYRGPARPGPVMVADMEAAGI